MQYSNYSLLSQNNFNFSKFILPFLNNFYYIIKLLSNYQSPKL